MPLTIVITDRPGQPHVQLSDFDDARPTSGRMHSSESMNTTNLGSFVVFRFSSTGVKPLRETRGAPQKAEAPDLNAMPTPTAI